MGSTKSQLDSLRDIRHGPDEQTFGNSGLDANVGDLSSAERTLSVVNQHFGSLLSTTDLDSNLIDGSDNHSQSSFAGSAGEFADPNQAGISNSTSTMPNFDQPATSNEDNSISSLRAQLAQMFDLTQDPASSFGLIEELNSNRQSSIPQESNPIDGAASESMEPFPLQTFSIDQLATESISASRQQSIDARMPNPDDGSTTTESVDVPMNENEADDPGHAADCVNCPWVAERSPEAPPPVPSCTNCNRRGSRAYRIRRGIFWSKLNWPGCWDDP